MLVVMGNHGCAINHFQLFYFEDLGGKILSMIALIF